MTSTWRTREELAHQVALLAKQGDSRRAIARALGVSRNTVRTLLAAHAQGRDTAQVAIPSRRTRAPRPSKLDAWRPRVAALMAKYAGITAQRVFEILRAEGFDGGYTGVKRYVRALRPRPKPTPSLTTPDYGPGEMAESDWSPYEIRFTTGKTAVIQALSYVLVSSKRKYFGLYESNDLHALMDGHDRAFARFDGCAHECKYDSQKPLLLRERYCTDEIDHALGHAAAFGARDHATVERILAARALPRTLDEYVAEDTARRLEQTLGHARAVPRDLTQYDRLPIASRSRAQEPPSWPSEAVLPDPSRETVDEPTTTPSSRGSDDTSTSSD